MLSKILLGFALGLLVSSIGYYLVQLPLKKIGQIPMAKIKQKVVNRYFLRNFATLLFLFILFKTTNTATLLSAGFGLTMARVFLFAKEYIVGKG